VEVVEVQDIMVVKEEVQVCFQQVEVEVVQQNHILIVH
jgi:hypothetical protein